MYGERRVSIQQNTRLETSLKRKKNQQPASIVSDHSVFQQQYKQHFLLAHSQWQ